MPPTNPYTARDLYAQAKKIDDLTLKVVAKSLPADLAEIISKRLLYDYVADVGAIGILRKLYLENLDLEGICRLYWGSRREIGNPHFESIFAQLLVNISASFIYDQIKGLWDTGVITEQWLLLRGIVVTASFLSPAEYARVFEHARLLHSLYRLKQTPAGAEIASKIVKKSLSDDLPLQTDVGDAADRQEFEIIIENMRVIARGVLIDSICDTGHLAKIPTGGLVLQGSPASVGIAWGRPIIATECLSSREQGDVVVAIDSHELDPESTVSALHLSTGAITGDPLTGHVPILARGIGRPCVGNISWKKQNLSNFSFAIVDGYAASVRLFVHRPAGYPELREKRTFYNRKGD